jgi:hypothetical protein
LLVEKLILQSSFPLGRGCGYGVQVYFEVPSRAAVGVVVLRDWEYREDSNRGLGLDPSRAGERVLISCSAVLFGGLRRDGGVDDLGDGVRWLVLGSSLE